MGIRTIRILAATLALFGVGLGAFGAHALAARLAEYGKDQWQTATQYLMFHVLAALVTTFWNHKFSRLAGTLFVCGIFVFSGSLYALALSRVKILGAITPIGGVLFLSGWICLILFAAKSTENEAN